MADEAKDVAEKAKKTKKLVKTIEGTVLTISEAITGSIMKFDFAVLPQGIKDNLGPYGLSQKLGDAAAGREGQDAVDSIKKVWEGLSKGDWSTRAPAAEKITKKSILDKYEAMPEGKEKAVAKGLLQKLGLIPEDKK